MKLLKDLLILRFLFHVKIYKKLNKSSGLTFYTVTTTFT